MPFDFEQQKKQGKIGEEIFYHVLDNKLIHGDKLTHDFVSSKGKIELKTDFYDITKTEYFFIERYSDSQKGSLGGPWQSQINQCKYFVYFFIKNGVYFVFTVDKFVEFLDNIVNSQYMFNIKNKGWITQGFKIKRKLLEHLYLEQNIENYSQVLSQFNVGVL